MRVLSIAAAALMATFAGSPVGAQSPEPAPHSGETPAAPVEGPAAAPELPPPAASARFAFSRVDGGYLRLDSVSGQVALCSQRSAGWVCQAVPEDRAALDSEIGRLQAEVTRLKSEVAALQTLPEPPRPPAEVAPRADGGKSGGLKLPTDADIKWARAAIENIWRQFVGMVAEFQKDIQR